MGLRGLISETKKTIQEVEVSEVLGMNQAIVGFDKAKLNESPHGPAKVEKAIISAKRQSLREQRRVSAKLWLLDQICQNPHNSSIIKEVPFEEEYEFADNVMR